MLIGATGAPGTFTQEVVERMSALNARPVLFALSNPTSRAECTAEQAYRWSRGQAVFASGSPFGAVTHEAMSCARGRATTRTCFPGIGLGAVLCRARRIPDEFFLTAARILAGLVTARDLGSGSLYPPLRDIRRISLAIAVSVAETRLPDEARPREAAPRI